MSEGGKGWLIGCYSAKNIVELTLIPTMWTKNSSNRTRSPGRANENLGQAETGCSLNNVFFSKILKGLPLLPRQHSAAIGCTKNLALRWELSRSLTAMLGEGGVAVHCEKNTFFPEHPVWISLYMKYYIWVSIALSDDERKI